MRLTFVTFAASLLCASAGMAETVDGKAARGLLFSPKGAEVTIVTDILSEKDAAILAEVGQTQSYYGAIAISPDEGILSNATVAAANYHDVANASRAALAGCNAAKTGASACVIAAEIRPKDWEERALQLNVGATEAVRKDYRKGRGAKALAVSASTGQWGIGKGDSADQDALSACKSAAKADDCRIVVADRAK